MGPAAGQIQVAATLGGTCTDFDQDTDALCMGQYEKWIFGGS